MCALIKSSRLSSTKLPAIFDNRNCFEMAIRSSPSADSLFCLLCHDILNDPVVMSCSHGFCRACLQNYWEHYSCLQCPLCRRKICSYVRLYPIEHLAYSLGSKEQDSQNRNDKRNEDVKRKVCVIIM